MPQNTNFDHTGSEEQAFAYKKRLNPWVIARVRPDTKREIVARFRSRSDADGHLQLLQQLKPQASFMLVFDCESNEVVV